MQLSDLKLDRYLRRTADDGTRQNDVASATVEGGSSGGSGAGPVPGSSGTEPGSPPIVSILLQSSSGDDRVEINPDDHFYAYNGGDIVVEIGKDGIRAETSIVTTQDTETLNVTEKFNYLGIPQPVVYTGIVDSTGAAIILPAGWTSVRNSIGNYTITHNLNTLIPFMVTFAPMNGHFRCSQNNRTANSFDVDWEETLYGSDTFPVSGGGGGSVTVDGVRIPPNEVGVDVTFQFIFMQNLP